MKAAPGFVQAMQKGREVSYVIGFKPPTHNDDRTNDEDNYFTNSFGEKYREAMAKGRTIREVS
jgi:hypothetical protein